MDPRLSQSIYFLFRASREEGYKAGTRFHAEHTTKLRWSSLTPRHLASSSLSWQSEGKVPKVDRQSICNTKFDGSHNDLAAKKQIDVRPKDTRRLLSSFTGSVQGVSLKTQHSHIHYGSLSGPIRFSSTSAASAASGKTTGYKGIKDPSDITQNRYNQLADDYLEAVQQWLEDLSDADENVEVEFSAPKTTGMMPMLTGPRLTKAGVLTVTLPPAGTYVINKQPPNKQIWLSSPVSGPKRYDYVSLNKNGDNGDWVYLRDGSTMTNLLRDEMGIVLPEN